MAGDDRLSDLPDKLLQRILYFAPAKEAASTKALLRRWRSPLLRFSGAVNLETHVEDYDHVVRYTGGQERKDLEAVFFSRRDAFVSASEAALDAAADHVTRLSLRVEFNLGYNWAERFLNRNSDWSLLQGRGVVARLLSHRAARRIEELRLASECWYTRPGGYDDDKEKEISKKFTAMYTISVDSLPSETLRVLDLVSCCVNIRLPAGEAVFFPRLMCLRLRRSDVHLNVLQSLIDSAPRLATVHLETVLITRTDDETEAALRCPAATVLMLDRCNWIKKQDRGEAYDYDWVYEKETPIVIDMVLEIHAPRLRRFLYKGILREVSLSPPPPDLTRTDLHFFPAPYETSNSRYDDDDPYRKPAIFWRFLENLSSCKELKLRVKNLEAIAILSEARRVELLPVFSNLQCLELQGMHRSKGKTAAVAIANLLRCSPVLSHLRMNLTTAYHGAPIRRDVDGYVHEYLVQKFQSDRDKSLHLINRCSEDDDTPGLSRRLFECLQTSLTKVSLQFRFEDSNCFGIKLIRFFVENALLLEEMHIDSGNGKLCQHTYHKIETWISNLSMKRRRSGASSFVVLPLKR